MFIELMGDVGGILFGMACVPMAWAAWKKGNTKGIPTSAMWLFFNACVLYYGWLFLQFGFHLPFVIGIVEIVCWVIVLKYRYFPRRNIKAEVQEINNKMINKSRGEISKLVKK